MASNSGFIFRLAQKLLGFLKGKKDTGEKISMSEVVDAIKNADEDNILSEDNIVKVAQEIVNKTEPQSQEATQTNKSPQVDKISEEQTTDQNAPQENGGETVAEGDNANKVETQGELIVPIEQTADQNAPQENGGETVAEGDNANEVETQGELIVPIEQTADQNVSQTGGSLQSDKKVEQEKQNNKEVKKSRLENSPLFANENESDVKRKKTLVEAHEIISNLTLEEMIRTIVRVVGYYKGQNKK